MLPLSRILIYDNDFTILNGNYNQIATTPTGYFNFGSVSYLNRIYVMGGVTSGAALTQSCYFFDPDNPTVRTSIANLPRILFNFGCTIHDTKIYVYGGVTRNTPTGTNIDNTALYVYDILTNTWSNPTSTYKPSTGAYCKMVTIGSDIYLHGLNSDFMQLYKLDTSTLTFTSLASSSTALAGSVGGMCSDGIRYIYVSTTNVIERYDITNNTWNTIQTNTNTYGDCIYLNNYVYIQDRLKFGRYDVSKNVFDVVTTPVNIYRGAIQENRGKVYCIMGYDGSSPSNVIYRIT